MAFRFVQALLFQQQMADVQARVFALRCQVRRNGAVELSVRKVQRVIARFRSFATGLVDRSLNEAIGKIRL